MTALEQYIRLEATGRWRAPGGEDWREVLVSFGNATLVLSDFEDHPLTHWSLAATRATAAEGETVTYAPDMGSDESLQIRDAEMNTAIAEVTERARGARPVRVERPRRWPLVVGALLVLATAAAALGPGLLRARALRLVPEARADLLDNDIRDALGTAICRESPGQYWIETLAARLAHGETALVTDWTEARVGRLPGGTILLSRGLIEAAITPEELAGWIALGGAMTRDDTTLARWVGAMSPREVLAFLASARIGRDDIAAMVGTARATPLIPRAAQAAAAARTLAANRVDPRAFLSAARASFPGLAAVAPVPATDTVAPLTDQAWVAVQGICG